MKMVQCEKGHFYDQERSGKCPYCNNSGNDTSRTVAFSQMADNDDSFTMPVNDDIGKTVAIMPGKSMADNDDDVGKTVAIFKKKKNFKIDPVVGWLTAITGPEKGRDYRIHSDNNFIGRDSGMDICIDYDETISREKHAIISFDTRSLSFFLSPSEGRSIIRINDMPIYQTTKLNDFDRIELGETLLIFRSLCGENFSWED